MSQSTQMTNATVRIEKQGGPEEMHLVDMPVGEPAPAKSASATTPAA